jgi:branched-chain amino acid transport system substrate-binding protein
MILLCRIGFSGVQAAASSIGREWMSGYTRRDFIAGTGSALLLAAAPGGARAAAKVIKLGMSLAMSGPVASIGESVWRGANLYHKLNQGNLPKEVVLDVILRDDGGNADNIKRIVQEFIVRERVQLLGGAALSPQAFAVAPLVTQAKTPFVILNASTSRITRESPWFVRTAATLWQTGYTIGEWAPANGYKRTYTLVSDYAAGLDVEAAFTSAFTKKGGQIAGSVRAPLTTTDYLPYMENIKPSGADSVFMFVPAGRVGRAVAAFGAAGLKGAGIRLIGTGDIAPDDELLDMGEDVAGLVTAGVYYSGNPVPANVDFVKAWKAEYGAKSVPNYIAAAGWDGLMAIHDLIRTTGGNFTSDQAIRFLSTWKTANSPRGPISIDPDTHDIVQSVYISRVELIDGLPASVSFGKIADVKDPWKELNPAGAAGK